MKDAAYDLRQRELELKYDPEKMRAELDKTISEVVKNNVASAFAAMQAGEKIALVPAIAPVADVVMEKSGWRQPTPAGQDPNFIAPPQPGIAPEPMPVDGQGVMPMEGDTSPLTPQSPESPFVDANQGMDTLRTD